MHTYTRTHKWSYSQMHSLAHSSFRFVRVCPFAEPLLIFTCLFFNFVNISRSIGQWKCQNIQQTLSHLYTHTHTHMYSYMDVRMHVCVSSFLSNSFIPKSYKMHHKCRVCVYVYGYVCMDGKLRWIAWSSSSSASASSSSASSPG